VDRLVEGHCESVMIEKIRAGRNTPKNYGQDSDESGDDD